MKKAFLICPDYHADKAKKAIKALKKEGYTVYWTPQDGKEFRGSVYDACINVRRKIWDAKVVCVIVGMPFDGCMFELGIAFAFSKSIRCIETLGQPGYATIDNLIRE